MYRGKNYVDEKVCVLTKIPAYASNIYSSGNGLAGELTVPPTSLSFWNCTNKSISIDGKDCLELLGSNKYRFDRKNLLEYMSAVHQEYSTNLLHEYDKFERKVDSWKNVNEAGWVYRYQKIKKRTFKTEFELYLKPTKDASNRYYISSKAEDFLFVIAYCIIPEYTNIRIEKTVCRDGSSVFTFYLEAIGFDNIQEIIEDSFTEKEGKYFETVSEDELYKKAKEQGTKCKSSGKVTTTKIYDRDPQISAYVKKRAQGKCDLCGEVAPFLDKKGNPYLEEHHVVRLADGGEDTMGNAVALCPNCHRKVHILNSKELNTSLQNRLAAYIELEKKYNS